jgi:hypothetical protein
MPQTKEERLAQMKLYRESEKGKASIKAGNVKYQQSEKGKATRAKYAQTEKGKEIIAKSEQSDKIKKYRTIQNWKTIGLIHDNYEELYEEYLECNRCDICNTTFKNRTDRNMDHCHISGAFRQFLCRSCNHKDKWIKIYFAGFFD